jgi:DNA-binding FadR family transcriptional regulator
VKVAILDEAGDVGYGESASAHFLVVAVVIGNVEMLRKIATRVRKRLDKRRRDIPEFKASKTDPRIIRNILAKIAAVECEIIIVAADKRKVPQADDLESLYRNLCACAARQCVERYGQVTLVLDKRYTHSGLTEKLVETISRSLENVAGVLAIEPPRDSQQERAIQVVDAVAWATFQRLERNNMSFYELVKSRVVWEEWLE